MKYEIYESKKKLTFLFILVLLMIPLIIFVGTQMVKESNLFKAIFLFLVSGVLVWVLSEK